MKKKRLEQAQTLYATHEMLRLVREDIGKKERTRHRYATNINYFTYERHIYFRAAPVEDNILMVAMYFRQELAAGIIEPHFNIFLDRDRQEQASFDLRVNKWRTGNIESLYWSPDLREKGMEYRTGFYADKQTKDMVNRYLEAERQEVKTLIAQFQKKLKAEKLKAAHKRESDEIDEAMALVPDIPADFEDWITEYGFYTSRYIFYHAEGNKREKDAFCMQCGSSIKVIGAKRDKKYKCPVCRAKALLKPWTSKNVREEAAICLIQRLTDNSGWVTRRFRAVLLAKKEEGWSPSYLYCEEVRETYTDELIQYGHYEFGRYKNTGISRWCYTANEPARKGWYRDDFIMGEARVYWKNLCKERKGTLLQYIPLEKALKREPGVYMHIHDMMSALRKYPEVEYFIKMGFKRLSIDILKYKVELKPGKKPWEALGISKELMQSALKYDVTYRRLELMKAVSVYGYQLTKQQLDFFSKYFNKDDIGKILKHATPHKMYRYYTEVLVEKRNYGDYLDYLRAAEVCGYDMRNEMVLFPKQFRQAHDMAVEEQQERERKLENMAVRRKNKEYAKMVPGIKELYEFEDERFFIKVPEKKSDFTREGHMNNNCVATYFDRVVKGKTVVVFLRKKDMPDQAYCTVEITNVATIAQLRSRYNREAPPEAKTFAEAWMKEVKKRIAKKELEERRGSVPIQVAVG